MSGEYPAAIVGKWTSKGVLPCSSPKDLEDRLDHCARKAGRTNSELAREAILEKIEDLADIYLAEERLKNPGETIPFEQIVAEFADDLEKNQDDDLKF